MAFWNIAASEPRRQHRFLLNLPLLAVDGQAINMQYLAKTVSKPAYTIGETEHKFLGNTYYYPGAVTWDPVTATLVNAVAPDGNKILYQALYRSGYFDPFDQSKFFGAAGDRNAATSAAIAPGTPNKAAALAATGHVIIQEIDGFGKEIGKWTLRSPFITNAKFGDLDYAGEELLNLEVTFRYDYAVYESIINGTDSSAVTNEAVNRDKGNAIKRSQQTG